MTLLYNSYPDAPDDQLQRFLDANTDLPVELDGLIIHFYSAGYRHYHVCLELAEDTTVDDIRGAWYVISEWKRRLYTWQGPCKESDPGSLYRQLYDNHKKGLSYQRLADQLNDDVVRWLRGYFLYKQEFEKNKDRFGLHALPTYPLTLGTPEFERIMAFNEYISEKMSAQKIEGIEPTGWAVGLGGAIELLQFMGLSEIDAQEWCQEILANLEAGKPPCLLGGGPITKDHVISRIRAWRQKIGEQAGS